MSLTKWLALTITSFLVVFLFVGVVGCVVPAAPTPTPTETVLPATPTFTPQPDTPTPVQPTPTPEPPTPVPPTSTPVPLPTATPFPTPTSTPRVTTESTKLDGGWTLYEKVGEGFGLALPPGWTQVDLDEQSLKALFEASADDPDAQLFLAWLASLEDSPVKFFGFEASPAAGASGFRANVNVLKQEMPAAVSLDTVVDLTVSMLKEMSGLSGPITHKRVNTTSGAAEELKYKLTYSATKPKSSTASAALEDDGGLIMAGNEAAITLAVTQYIVVEEKEEYVVTLEAPASQSSKYSSTFSKIGQSIRLGRPRLLFAETFASVDDGLFAEDEGKQTLKLSSGKSYDCQWNTRYSGGALLARIKWPHTASDKAKLCGGTADIEYGEDLPDQLAVEVRAKATKSPSAAIFGVSIYSDDATFGLYVSPGDGYYGIGYYGDDWQWLKEGRSGAIKRGTGENLLRLEVRGSTLVAFVNGQEVARIRHEDLPLDGTSAGVEFLMAGPPAKGDVEIKFDDFKVYELRE